MVVPTSSHLNFTVRRRQPELVAPAKPTPHEFKPLSDLDDQECLRAHIPLVHFYRHKASMAGKDPVKVIKDALAQTLVFYYPFAGRLREVVGRKLLVECNGEGILFIEADADVTLAQFGDNLKPPFPRFNELLYNVPGSEGILHCPLLLIQVTRLKCGGFVFAIRMNHTMTDGPGIFQFMNALAEVANGASEPSIIPVWHRKLLSARDPPRVSCTHREFDEVVGATIPLTGITYESFFFGPTEISALRHLIPHHLQKSTTFEVLTACLWRCRTKALQLDPNDDVRALLIVNTRFGQGRFNPPIPCGYYGNAFVYPAAVATSRELCESPLGHALELVKKAKAKVSAEYVHSMTDFLVTRGRPCFTSTRSWMISDLSCLGFRDVNFGWGKAVYAGLAKAGLGPLTGVSFSIASANNKGEEGRLVLMCLPSKAMKIFGKELGNMLGNYENNQNYSAILSHL
ncbi:benzyl alcohol O-benzoyltransferase-like [Prosopis cineraria]|uniref:benzyl alcohol O-benzoyltransferase-like n=1 Tax=Prosopis cineraria TaxID=364024 RepID=UPI00240F8382|nr:benzyl alcohol O-benzoyltransferase-like [Prosopis cineraria]